MTERTITEKELIVVLSGQLQINTSDITHILRAAFPPIFKPKEGEVIWVRTHEEGVWVLRVHIEMINGFYSCKADSPRGYFAWGCAKPQTPTQKGE
jgi:hypothetical protein